MMDIEDPDEFIPDNSDYEEVIKLVQNWGSSHLNEYKKDTIKIYFYSPVLFDRFFLEEKNWNDATKERLITSSDLKPSVAKKFISQMAAMEKSFSTVCDAFQEIQQEDQWKDDIIALLRFTDKRNKNLDLDDIIQQVNDIPFFEQLRDPLHKYENSSLILLLCLKNFFYLLSLFVFDEDKDPREALRDIPDGQLFKVTSLKNKGNVMFQKNKYCKALTYYSSAIVLDCYNPVLYCNRAQANLYLDKNWEALLDAKRAVLLKPAWPKAYYRYSQALYELQFIEEAIEENRLGQQLCHDSKIDIKDLQTQLSRFLLEKERVKYIERLFSVQLPSALRELDLDDDDDDSSNDSDQKDSVRVVMNLEHNRKLSKFQQESAQKFLEAKRKETKEANRLEENKRKQEMKKRKEQQEIRRKEKELQRIKDKKEKEKQMAKKEQEREEKEKLNSALQIASKCYLDGRTRQAFEGYQRAEEIMKQSTKEFGGLTECDVVIYLYAYGMAALETGNPQLYSSAVEKFESILTDHRAVRTALPYYGKALAYFKMNRFKDAFDPIEKGKHINKTFPTSVETWPGTDIDIEQTKRDCMEKFLSELEGNCRKPPPPETYCRYENCSTRQEIYVNDISFKGYVKVHCSEDCKVDYHIGCWKNLRESVDKKTDKDMLGTNCFTPDCQGLIEELSVYGEDGLVITNQNVKGQQEKTKVKTSSKPSKKDKKSKKSKFKEKGQGESHISENDPSDVNLSTVTAPLLDVGIVLSAPSVCSSDGGDSSMTPDLDTVLDDIAESTTLHQDAAYVLKKDEPQEKTAAPKVSKGKSKKKKKEAVTLDVDFADKNSRYLFTDADAPDSTSVPPSHTWYFSGQHQPEVVLLSEEDRNAMFVVHLHFEEILENNGPLQLDDSILLDEISRLSSEHQGIINKHGGLAQFFSSAPDMFSVVENYVCRKEDLSKCRDIIGRQKIVWAPLPSASNPTREPLLGRTPWANQNHPKKDNIEENYQKPNKMNCLDMFNEGDLSEGTDVSIEDDLPPGITRQGFVYDQLDPITVSSREQSEEEGEDDDGSNEERDSEIIDKSEIIPNEEPVVDNFKVTMPSVQEVVVVDEIPEQGVTPAGINDGEVSTQGAPSSGIDNSEETQPLAKDHITTEDAAVNLLDPLKVTEAGRVPLPVDPHEEVKPQEDELDIRGNVDLSKGENANGAAPILSSEILVSNYDSGISLENMTMNYREDDLYYADPKCNSEVLSDSVNSGSSSSSGVSSDNTSVPPALDSVVLWRKSAKDVLSLFPEFGTNGEAVDDNEALIKIFSVQFYELLEGLKERGKMHLKRTIGTCTYTPKVSHSDRGVNTDPLRTYEKEYLDVMAKHKTAESNLLMVSSKCDELVKRMSIQQATAKTEEAMKSSVIERLQQSIRLKDEKMQQDNSFAQREKARLSEIIRNYEAGARDMQKKLDEYNRIKETADKMKTEKDLMREEFQRKLDEINKECQRQRQRAIKSEINIVQIHKDQAMKPLLEAVTECNYHISHLTRILKQEENANLTVILKDWERCLEENKQKVETTKNHFDHQLSQLRSGLRMLTDLPVIPHPEPSRSKSLKSSHPPQNWPSFGAPPPLPGSTMKGTATPFLRQQGMTHPPPQKPLNNSTSVVTNGTPSTHAPGLPPARGTASAIPQAPGSTMPLAPGPGAQPSHGLNHHMPVPIGTRNSSATPPLVQGVTREKTTDLSAKVKHVPQLKSDAPAANAVPAKFPPNSQGRVSERQATTAPRSSYQRIMERLQKKFPHYNKVQLTNFLKVVRVNNGNSLSGLSMEGIMNKVADLIAEAEAVQPQKPYVDSSRESHQVAAPSPVTRNTPVTVIPAAPAKNPWSLPVDDISTSWQNEVYDDEVDPCVICHEEMSLKEVLDLECGHRFHADCIEEWLGTKSTCPNCRKFTKLKQEYPPLQL